MFALLIKKLIIKHMLKKLLGSDKVKVALESHSVGVLAIAVAVGTYITMHPEQVVALLGERYGGILLVVVGAVGTVARLYKAKPTP